MTMNSDDDKDRQEQTKTNILGVSVCAVNMDSALARIDVWIAERSPNFACFRDVHGVMVNRKDPELQAAHEHAGMVAPDGMPLVWLSRLAGHHGTGRVCGPDFMPALCKRSVSAGYRHFFYGGAPGVAERLAANLRQRFLGLQVVGTYSPPFRPLTQAEDAAVIRMIDETSADIVWVGLSTPKQEKWMMDHVGRVTAPVLLRVGAAFDFHAGTVRRAPVWMQQSGLEWLFRLLSQPRRLWRRYLVLAPAFLFLVPGQILGLKHYPKRR